jgi:hypothetical protein
MPSSLWNSARRHAARFVWARPILYKWVGILRSRGNVFNEAYDMVYDGFHRSGSTFGALMLIISQEDRVKVQYHKHIPTFLIVPPRLHKPVCLTIRPPLDAVISWVIYTHNDVGSVLEKYIDFYSVLLPYRSEFLVIPFDFGTGDFRLVINLINQRFGLKLKIPGDLEACKKEAFRRIDEIWKDSSGTVNEAQVARPSSTRARPKSELLLELKKPQYAEPLRRCQELYDIFYQEFKTTSDKYLGQRGV